MVRALSVRFGVGVLGKAKIVLAAHENATGNLTVIPRHGRYGRADGTAIHKESSDPGHGQMIVESHASVHISDQSGTNTITLKVVYGNGNVKSSYIRTSAIKSDDKFIPIYIRRCPDGSFIKEQSKRWKTARLCWLEKKMGHSFTLIFTVFVGPRGRKFSYAATTDFCYQQVEFTKFSILILYSFVNVPPTSSGGLTPMSSRDQIASGMDEIECVNFFYYSRQLMLTEFLNELNSVEEFARMMPRFRQARFFRKTVSHTNDYTRWNVAGRSHAQKEV